ncbi:MAG TPA: 50S ribosomal protein L6 [Leptospiraceae bacterium]|jgi:large subunit ribosomal protein L6|nr:50S ribosomal protein L6 [Leptospirales bacterium]HMU85298.1 50S ribosomal protein L6 [Leptospiraceae bacterium]HMW61664.1 50S ribosomal protein L6 [Leptospiraceae bacterium]HMY44142.1 50S ribosomal protein L6 [Leptospiraceae bacterium]HNE24943.1 50S ribosomal protein L6 [Leptospiraceae bacterium]
MSRIGNAPIQLPQGVDVEASGDKLKVKGPLGTLESPLPAGITLSKEGGVVNLKRANDEMPLKQKHGMARAILMNSVIGVSKGWEKKLELVGVGYRAQMKGADLSFSLGYSHEVKFQVPAGIKVQVTDQVRLDITGIDRQKVGQTASEIRSLRPPEPYKGKGIKYAGENIRRKAGKTGKAGKGK